MGFGFLVEWVIDGWSKLTRTDYAIVLLILVVIGGTDFLIGVGVGLVAMIILFVMKYSRINVVRHALSGAEMSSNVQRSTYHQRVLRELGQGVYILELQGFIFFGTGNVVLERIRARLSDDTGPEVRFVVLDFRRVNGLDTSAAMSFIKAKQLTEALGITLLLTNVTEEIQRQFEVSGLSEDEGGLRVFTDLDHGLEWCENQLLEIGMVTMMVMPTTLRAQLTSGGFSKDDTARLTEFLEKTQFEQGEHLIQQGEQADDLFFIEFGEGVAYLELEGGARVRLRTIDPGTVVGEMALYLGTTRIESVIANTRIIAYRLTQEALSEMREAEPELAANFHEYIVRLLSERLINTTRVLEAVLK
jgi:SulP family sulfate permease